jgi:peptidyl-tRNA hydrolase, PTH1 family
MDSVALIVGLGNPGIEYARTRHNAGFMATDLLAKRWQVNWKNESRFHGRVAMARWEAAKVYLCQPATYMNLSGQAVGLLTEYYRIPHDRVLVLLDDADLPTGEIRLRPKGGPGGHHGLESVISHLGTDEVPRLRLGIGRPSAAAREITHHVLSLFAADEAELADRMIHRAADAAECWLRNGISKAMNDFNGPTQTTGTKDS